MSYELWDTESNNLFGEFETQDEALAAVRETNRLYGAESAAALALARRSPTGTYTGIADGPALVALASADSGAEPRHKPTLQRRQPGPATSPAPPMTA